jgi:hypothetical protein
MIHKQHTILSVPSILIIFMLLGCSGGLLLSHSREYELRSQWRSLGMPPVRPEKLLAADFYTVYVQTSDQQIYSCYRASRLDQRCWILITAVPPIEPGGCASDQPQNAPPPPVEPIQQIYVSFCDRFNRSEFTYVLGRDGTVMQWVDDRYHANLPPVAQQDQNKLLLWGIGSGFTVGLVLVGVRAYARRQPHQ